MDNQQRKELQEASYSANYENTNFSSYLMEQIRTTHMNCQYMVDEHVNDQEEEEEEEDDDEEDVEKAENPEKPADISPEDKAQLEEEFRSQMMESFLMGKDSDFDYSRVDENEDYDMSDQFERDQEDRYFDED